MIYTAKKKKRDISNVSDSCHNLYKKCSLDIKEFGNQRKNVFSGVSR